MTIGAPRGGAVRWRDLSLPLWAAVPLAAAGGFALDLAFPSTGIWPLAFAAVAAQLVALIGRRAWSAFLVGLVFGAAFFFPHIDWITSFLGDNELRWVPWVALAGLESVFMGAGAALIALGYRYTDRLTGWARILAVPALVAGLWTLRENVMGSWPYGGFAWGRIGMSQPDSPFATLASWAGIPALTFLIVWMCGLAVEAVRVCASPGRAGRRRGRRAAPAQPASVLLAVAVPLVLALVPLFPTAVSGSITVGAVQGDGPTAYLDPHDYLDAGRAQLEASQSVFDADVDVVLWPEGALGGDPRGDAQARAFADGAQMLYGAPLILNAASEEGDEVFNMSMVWEDGTATQTHSKRHPVPFGEYVPDREIFERIAPSLIGLLQREYAPGADAPLFDVAGAKIGLAICFDVISDSLIRSGALDGAQVYMFQTNNADFRGTDESEQQLAFARMRAIETGRAVVNLSTTGVSEIIEPDGSTDARIDADEAGAMVEEIELRDGLTAGVLLGPWVSAVLAWGALIALVIARVAPVVAARRAGRRRDVP